MNNPRPVGRAAIGAFLLLLAIAVAIAPMPARAQQDVLERIYRPALPGGKVRTYYIAAEEVQWDYAPTGEDVMMGHPIMGEAALYVERGQGFVGRTHTKAVYFEYTDETFATKKRKAPEWAHTGILGPVLRAEVGDVIRVIFKNKTTRSYSLHPHGVFYLKADEGAPGNDGTSLTEKRDDAVPPEEVQVYVWPVPVRAGPGPRDGSSLAWAYHSHTDRVRDINSGLVGVILVTRRGMATASLRPRDVDREFITLWNIFNENKSWYLEDDVEKAGGNLVALRTNRNFRESNRKHAVNGFIFANLPIETLRMRKGERVRWYSIALGDERDLHTPHWHGNTVLVGGQRMDVVSLLPATHVVANMVPDNPGIWMLHCHVDDHLEGGMAVRYEVLPAVATSSIPASRGSDTNVGRRSVTRRGKR